MNINAQIKSTFLFLFIFSGGLYAQWEKEVQFDFGFNRQQNGDFSPSMMSGDFNFDNTYDPIATDGESSFSTSWTRHYGLSFALRKFLTEYWFLRPSIGVQEVFLGFTRNYELDENNYMSLNSRIKYFAIPVGFSGGYSYPFQWRHGSPDQGAFTVYGGGNLSLLMSPGGQSEVLITADNLSNTTTNYQDHVFMGGVLADPYMRNVLLMSSVFASIAVEYNEVTFSAGVRFFSSGNVYDDDFALFLPDTDASNSNENWHGWALDFGISIRFR